MAETAIRRINIYINTEQGQAALEKLNIQKQKTIDKLYKLKQGTKEWTDGHKDLKKIQDGVTQIEQQLAGKLTPTMKQLTSEQNTLNRAISNMPIELRKASAEYKRLQEIMAQKAAIKASETKQTSMFDSLKGQIIGGAMGVVGGLGVTALAGGVANFFSSRITGAAELSDQLADIRKTTNMTTAEVESLNSSLGKINTRTATKELRDMAIVAGQFNIPKEQILGFVEAIDKVNIALGDEFTGGAEQIATEMSKLRNVLGDTRTGNIGLDIELISNAVNALGAAGVATGPVVTDIAQRIGGAGNKFGISSGQILGTAAAMQELSIGTERGSTAFIKIMQKMSTNVEDFALIAGAKTPEAMKEFANMVNTDMFGAFMKVVEGSNKSGSSNTALAKILKDLEVDGAGATEMFAKFGKNIDLVKSKVDLASASLDNNNSITQEASLKQENLAGKLEKLSKSWTKLTSGGAWNTFAKVVIDSTNYVIESMTNIMTNGSNLSQQSIEELNTKLKEAQNNQLAIWSSMNNEKLIQQLQFYKNLAKIQKEHAQDSALIDDGKWAAWNRKMKAALVSAEAIQKIINERGMVKNTKTGVFETTEEIKVRDSAEKEKERFRKQSADKAITDFQNLQKEIAKLQEDADRAKLSKNDAEILAIEQKYAKLLARAIGHSKEIKQLVQLEYDEKAEALDKQISAAEEAYKKEADSFLKAQNEKTLKLKEELKKQLTAIFDQEFAKANMALLQAETEQQEYEAKLEIEALRRDEALTAEGLTADAKKLIWEQYYQNVETLEDNHQKNILKNLQGYAQAFESVLTAVNNVQNANSQAEIRTADKDLKTMIKFSNTRKEAELANLEDKHNRGLLSDEQYNLQKNAIDLKYNQEQETLQAAHDEKIDRINKAAAKRQHDFAVLMGTIKVGLAWVEAFIDPTMWPRAIAASAELAALVAIGVPEMAEGGNTALVKGQSGQTYNANYVGSFAGGGKYKNASYGIIAEKGEELVIPNWLYKSPKMIDTMKMLEYSIASQSLPFRQFAVGGSTQSNVVETMHATSQNSNNSNELLQAINLNTQVQMALLSEIKKGFYAKFVYDEFIKEKSFLDNSLNKNN